MPQPTKYSDQDIENIIKAVQIAINAQKAPTDLALMALGETVLDLVQKAFADESQMKVVEQFCLALKQSAQNRKS